MYYLNLTNYSENLKDLINEKVELHFKKFPSAPRFLLIGIDRTIELSELMWSLVRHHDFYDDVYALDYAIRESGMEYMGLDVVVVHNNKDVLEVA